MLPEISMLSFAHPSQLDTALGAAGTTSATGRPNRVTRTGAPVRRTSSKTAKQVALNLEIAISRIFKLYHSPRLWSEDLESPARPPITTNSTRHRKAVVRQFQNSCLGLARCTAHRLQVCANAC